VRGAGLEAGAPRIGQPAATEIKGISGGCFQTTASATKETENKGFACKTAVTGSSTSMP